MSEVAINYKGSSIATMDASGTKTLLTSGKYCESDIAIVYTRPASGIDGDNLGYGLSLVGSAIVGSSVIS